MNKNNSDYGVAILDENKLIFTSADELEKGSKKNYNPRKELFIGDIDHDGEILNIERVTKKENNKFNTTGIAYTSDFKTVYFSRNKYLRKRSKQKLTKNQRLELYKADVDSEGNWINIQLLPFNKEKISTGHPVLSKDNKKLYFVSDRLPSQGKTDIFYVDILGNGKYGVPQNLGQNVNTSGTETTPFLANGNILYFSSDGHQGDGNLDVFAVELYGDSTSEVYHLAAPINSINDDFAYIVNKDNNLGFFTSNRLQGKGFNDLYSFILEADVRPGECFISVDGKVKDKDTEEIISGATVELYNLDGSLVQSATTFDDGTYNFTVSCASEYKLVASNKDYKSDIKIIEILEKNYHKALHANLHLSKIHVEKKEMKSLQPIYFEFDKAFITDTAAEEMDRISKVMKDNPNLIIEASAFTDSQGSGAYNLQLSKRRAKAAVEYLKSKGIDAQRIRSRGYGEEKLVNECVNGIECDDSKHQMNRRTEFNFMNIQASRNDNVKAVTRKTYIASNATSEFHGKKKKKKAKAEKTNKRKGSSKRRNSRITSPKTRYAAAVDMPAIEDNKSISVQSTTIVPKGKEIKTEDKTTKTIIANNNKKEENNKALNYIEEEKFKMIDKYVALEKKFELAITEHEDTANSLKSEKQKIAEYKNKIENAEEIGWSNIIEYKNNLIQFNKKYNKLINPNQGSSNGEIIIIGEYNPTSGVKMDNGKIIEQIRPINDFERSSELTENDKTDKKILEENLRITNVEVIAMRMNSRGKYSETHSAKKTDLIKIKFKLLKNSKIVSGPKEAHIVMQKPNGKVAQAKGVFTTKEDNIEIKYTDQSIINYNKNDINVVLYIQRKGNNYEKGIYPIKLFLEGQLVAVSNLDLQQNF
ncbi:MAG: OmpA family protein [Flavobacteriaceae bacterium]|nr:OmpA family protein [Flavobacteriaceae bacterium]